MLGLQRGHAGLDVGFEGGNGLVDVRAGAVDVVVDVDHVEVASGAGVEEGGQEIEACGAPAVGDGWGREEGLPREGLHVLLVDFGSILRAEVCLAGVVGFIGTVEGYGQRLSQSGLGFTNWFGRRTRRDTCFRSRLPRWRFCSSRCSGGCRRP